MENWYAVQVRTGREEKVLDMSRKTVDRNVLKECFIPYCERMKRYQGEWHKEQYILFPGYVFLITERVEELYWKLKKLPEFTKILGDGAEFIPIKEEEKTILQKMGGKSYLAEMSRGFMRGDKVIITSGPLENMEGEIVYIDRHKRLAAVRIEMFDRLLEVKLGLEIVHKE